MQKNICVSIRLIVAVLGCSCAASALGANSKATATTIQNLNLLPFEELLKLEVNTVQRRESTVGQSPAAIHVITSEDIRRSGALQIAELFRRVPGADVARIDGNKWAIGVRGFNARFQDKLLVQVDGRSIYNPLFSGVFWDAVDYPLEDIERIEVVRGPGASVWGANAVNGVINIITKSAAATQGGLVVAGGGTENRSFGAVRYGGKINDSLHYRVYAKSFTHDEQFAATGNPNDQWRNANGGFRLDWRPSDADTVTFDAGYLESVASRMDLRPTTNPASAAMLGGVTFRNAFLNIENETTAAAHALARWSHVRGNDSNWSAQVYGDQFKRRFEQLDRDARHYNTFDLDLQQQVHLGERNNVVHGVGYRLIDSTVTNSAVDDGFIVKYRQLKRRTQLFSAFVQDDIAVVPDRLQLTLGTKVEHNEFTGWEVQPTARLLWTPSERQSGWAAVSRAVRSPNISEDDLERNHSLPVPLGPPNYPTGSIGFPELAGNPDLESEELLAYELGYRVQASAAVALDLALFYNVYDRLRITAAQPRASLALPPGQFTIPVQWQNGMTGETYGVELGSTWQINDRLRLAGAYTFLEMQLHRRAGLGAGAEAAEGQSPNQQFFLQASGNLPGQVELDLMARFVDTIRGFNTGNPNDPTAPNQIGGYVALDARLTWRPRAHVALTVAGQNLLDRHHPESGASATVRNPLVEIQRSIYAQITWQF